MRLKIYSFAILALSICACQTEQTPYPNLSDPERKALSISSNDTTLTEIFNWASERSEKYIGNDTDPVGSWYEAALPKREAFCMRDVSHQCIGEEINRHARQNLNMFTQFVKNISEEKDYCTYWEINKDNQPAPVDYENDQDFWYNLNANFDLLDASFRLYLWTGNETYIKDPLFLSFFQQSCDEYIDRWQLAADNIMKRPAIMNSRGDMNKKRFNGVRGLPSYEESVPHLKVTGDLIATLYRGLHSYASILSLNGKKAEASSYLNKANRYAQLYDSIWWNEKTQNYYSYCLKDNTFKEGGSNMFSAWFGIVKQSERLQSILQLMETKETNVESMSYYPTIFYRNGKYEAAYRFLQELYKNDRRDYPEVSSAILEGIVCGTAGVQANAITNTIVTCPQFTANTQWIAIENIPVLSGKISVIHYSDHETEIMNKTNKPFTWKVTFHGKKQQITKEGVPLNIKIYQDLLGNTFSCAEIQCQPREIIRVVAQ